MPGAAVTSARAKATRPVAILRTAIQASASVPLVLSQNGVASNTVTIAVR